MWASVVVATPHSEWTIFRPCLTRCDDWAKPCVREKEWKMKSLFRRRFFAWETDSGSALSPPNFAVNNNATGSATNRISTAMPREYFSQYFPALRGWWVTRKWSEREQIAALGGGKNWLSARSVQVDRSRKSPPAENEKGLRTILEKGAGKNLPVKPVFHWRYIYSRHLLNVYDAQCTYTNTVL